METYPENNFTAIVLARSIDVQDDVTYSLAEECVVISEPMKGNGYPYPKNCREDIERLLNQIREDYEFEGIEPIDICEIVTENGATLWNEGNNDGFTT